MKRSIIFWPLLSAVVVFLLWIAACLFMIGLPAGPRSLRCFSVPARRLLGDSQALRSRQLYIRLTWYFERAVNGLWQLAPYCFPSGSVPDSWREIEPPIGIRLPRVASQVGIGPGSRAGPFAMRESTSGYKPAPLSHAHVLLYVFLIPGAHFALAAFILVGVGAVLARLFVRFIPEGAAPPSRKQEAGEGNR